MVHIRGRLLFLSFLAVFSCLQVISAPARAQDGDKIELYRRAVETLIQSEAGAKATGKISISQADVADYRVQKTINWSAFAITHLADQDPPGGVLKITVGPYRLLDLRARWWKRQPISQTEFAGAELWSRPLTANSRRYVEVLIREKKRINNLTFELRMTFDRSKGAISTLLKRYELLLTNARINGLFKDIATLKAEDPLVQEKEKVIAEVVSAGRGYSGTWVGPMRNSKGGKISDSNVQFTVQADNAVTGTWYNGWKMTNGKRNGNVVTWEHRRVAKGCRDYVNKMVIEPGGTIALITYHVLDRCTQPSKYSGTHRVSKQE